MSDLNRIVSTALHCAMVWCIALYCMLIIPSHFFQIRAGVVESDYSVYNSKDSAPRSSVHSSWHEDKNAKLNLTRLVTQAFHTGGGNSSATFHVYFETGGHGC